MAHDFLLVGEGFRIEGYRFDGVRPRPDRLPGSHGDGQVGPAGVSGFDESLTNVDFWRWFLRKRESLADHASMAFGESGIHARPARRPASIALKRAIRQAHRRKSRSTS